MSCRQSSPSRCPALSGVGRSTNQASASCHLLTSNNRSTTTTVRPRAPPRLPHPPICRILNGLWASSSNYGNYGSQVPPVYLPSPRRQMRACLCLGRHSTCLRFLKRRPRGRIKTLAPPTLVSVLYRSLVQPHSPHPRPRVPAIDKTAYTPPHFVLVLLHYMTSHPPCPTNSIYTRLRSTTNRWLRFSLWTCINFIGLFDAPP